MKLGNFLGLPVKGFVYVKSRSFFPIANLGNIEEAKLWKMNLGEFLLVAG